MNESHFTENDRKLIIELSVQLKRALEDLAKLTDKFERREEEYATKLEVRDAIAWVPYSKGAAVILGAIVLPIMTYLAWQVIQNQNSISTINATLQIKK